MSKRLLLFLGVVVLAWTAPGSAISGYRELRRAYDAYRPPIEEFTSPHNEVFLKEKKGESAFDLTRKRIREALGRWEKTLSFSAPYPSFFSPDPALLASLGMARSEAGAAAESVRVTMSLERLKALALLRYPGVRAAEHRFRAVLEDFRQVTALDEILRRYTAFTEGIMTGVGPMKGKDPVRLKFPFPGVLALKAQIVQKGVQAAREALEARRRDAVVSVTRFFWDLVYNRRAQEITAETLGLYQHLHLAALARYESGGTSFQDVIKVRIRRDILADRLTTFRRAQGNIEMRIREFLDLPRDVPLGRPETPASRLKAPGAEALYTVALERNQELRRLRAEVEKMDRMVELAETMILPSMSFGFSIYEDEAVNQVGPTAFKATFPVSTTAGEGAGLPRSPFVGTQNAFLRQTRARVSALKQELARKERATVALVRRTWFELDRTTREQRLYREKVTAPARDALDVSTQGYQTGSVGFADVIASYDLWLQAHLTLEKNRAAAGKALAELERVIGTTLKP